MGPMVLLSRRDLMSAAALSLAACSLLVAPRTRSASGPSPGRAEGCGLFEAMRARRSVRRFTGEPVEEGDVLRLCWAAQGVTCPSSGYRAAPSAGATYPLEVYAATAGGVRHYVPREGALERVRRDDVRSGLAEACLGQGFVREAPLDLVLAAELERTTERYGGRGVRYVHLEAGHAAQNVLLAAVALGLGGVPVGAFDDDALSDALGLRAPLVPLYLVALGIPDERPCP